MTKKPRFEGFLGNRADTVFFPNGEFRRPENADQPDFDENRRRRLRPPNVLAQTAQTTQTDIWKKPIGLKACR